MSLSGTFETLPITEVLGLLAGSQKTGALRLEADGASATVFIDDGWCSAAEDDGHPGPVASEKELEGALIDVCFEVARHGGGTFAFDQDAVPNYESPVRIEIGLAVTELDDLLEQWRGIKEVVPSLEHRPRLASSLDVPSIEFDPERWKLLVSIDSRRSVRQIITKLEGSVIEVCREIAALVEVGAVTMAKAPKAAFAEAADDEVMDAPSASMIQPAAPYGPGVEDDDDEESDDPEPETADAAADESADPAGDSDDEREKTPDTVYNELSELADPEDGDSESGDDESPFGGPSDGAEDEDLGSAEEVAAAVEALKERGELPPDATAEEMRDRGALLRLFSALRDS